MGHCQDGYGICRGAVLLLGKAAEQRILLLQSAFHFCARAHLAAHCCAGLREDMLAERIESVQSGLQKHTKLCRDLRGLCLYRWHRRPAVE